jgi:hypothetical protein
MNKWIMTMVFIGVASPVTVFAQAKDRVVGTWKLVTATQTDGKGETKPAFGLKPTGFVTYTADGRMMVIIPAEGRKALSVNGRIAAPATERAEAFATMVAYAGRYSFTGDKVVHHVEASWMPNQVGTDLLRFVKLHGDRLVLRTPPMMDGGQQRVTELIWERMN